MLKTLLLSLMNLALAVMATAQNLVLNGSFEDTVDCDVVMSCVLPKALNWYNPTGCTPDLFDCDLERECGHAMDYPYWNGFMLSQDGERHAGEYFWDGPHPNSFVREFMMAELSLAMVMGEAYEVSLWYSSRRPHQYGVDHIGIWFGPEAVQEDTIGPMSLVPQIRLQDPDNAYLGESEVWTRLVDTLVAQGGERWLVIGNFDPVGQVNGSLVNPDGFEGTCYYYIDNVVIKHVPTTGMPERPLWNLWWNGTEWCIGNSAFSGVVTVEVFDVSGASLFRGSLRATGGSLAVGYDPPTSGTYIMRIIGATSNSTVRFIK